MNRSNYDYNQLEWWRIRNEYSRIDTEKLRGDAEKKRIENQALVLNQENTTTPSKDTFVGIGATCYSKGNDLGTRDAFCNKLKSGLVCARTGYDGRNFGGCKNQDGIQTSIGPPYNHHCCSNKT